MSLTNWLRNLQSFCRLGPTTRKSRRAARCEPAKHSRLQLEALEDRCLPSFSPAVIYPVGAGADVSVVVGDLNGDHTLDLLAGGKVLLGNGDGTFQPARDSGLVITPAVLADGNRDGILDALTVGSYQLGNGDGTFQPVQYNDLSGSGHDYNGAAAFGDVNNDGNPDLVLGWTQFVVVYDEQGNAGFFFSDGADVFLGDGAGGLAFSSSIGLTSSQSSLWNESLLLADFNGDGGLDIAATGAANNSVESYSAVLLGNGDGTFGPGGSSFGYDSPILLAGDFNGDNRLDIARLGNVQLGNGDGTFQPPQPYDYPAGAGLSATGDFNGDGRTDLVTTYPGTWDAASGQYVGTAYVSVLLSNGDGTFQAARDFFPGAGPYSLAVADFNGDGRSDLAVGLQSSGAIAVLLNDGNWSAAAPQASSFVVSGFPSPTTAGTAGTFTVTANTADGTTASGYTGTVHFTSSDAQAGLPADYTFTMADQGVHTFSAVLKTAGTQSLTATDLTTSSVSGTQAGITVNPAAASRFSVAGFPSPITAGVAGSFTVTASDPYGNRASGYTGTVHFSSSDAKAALPGNYTFTAADAGLHTFNATLKTAGTQSLTAADTVSAAISGAQGGILVNAATASRLVLSVPASVTAGASFSLTVTVVDAYGNVVTGYRGTLAFSSSDATANLPKNYKFTAADRGAHTFTKLVLKKKGQQTITVTDTLDNSIMGSAIIDVL